MNPTNLSSQTNLRIQSPYLKSLATTLPPHHIDQSEASDLAMQLVEESEEKRRLIPVLYRRSGVARRHSVLLDSSSGAEPAQQNFYQPTQSEIDRGPTISERMAIYERAARELAVQTASRSLQQSGVSPEEITHLVTVSCTGFSAPGFDIGLINDLGLNRHLSRTHIGFMGCHGAFNGLKVMKSFLDSDPDACVMLCATELCSLHQQYGWDQEKIVANSLFADGAACLVVRARDLSSAIPGNFVHVESTSYVIPDSEDLMSWNIGDHGFEMTLSSQLPGLIRRELRPWLEQWLQEQGITLEEVGSWAVHPGGPRILQACEEALGLEEDALAVSRQVLQECGNMSSPTVLFILQRLQQMTAPTPCVMLGFGPGITAEAALWM
ncbi:MAG: type III polyketide synthase [Planctomycetaceae bacterium]|nr:type III polyketide synthase [Planctomycetaceae bacterium]